MVQLHLATARLATQAGWMSYDATAHDDARRLWLIGLEISRAANLDDQIAFVLYDMAIQALALHRPEEALRLIHFGRAPAAGVSVATTSCLAALQGEAHAVQGDVAGCDRSLGHAVEYFGNIDPADDSWANFCKAAHLANYHGRADYKLALTGRDPRAADRAVPLLHQAVDGFGPDRARVRASALANLAGAHAVAGDTDTAVTVGHEAVDAVTALQSARAYDRLGVLHPQPRCRRAACAAGHHPGDVTMPEPVRCGLPAQRGTTP